MDIQEILSIVFSFVGSLLLVCFVVLLGWYFVWKFFLSRFRLVRELLGQISDSSTPSPSTSTDNNSRRSRPKKARRE